MDTDRKNMYIYIYRCMSLIIVPVKQRKRTTAAVRHPEFLKRERASYADG